VLRRQRLAGSAAWLERGAAGKGAAMKGYGLLGDGWVMQQDQ